MGSRFLPLALALCLCACSTTPVVAPSQFPKPVLRKVPVAIGLYMDPGFRSYVHHDKPVKAPAQDVSVGGASQTLFTEFLTAQFATLAVLPTEPSAQRAAPAVQAVLQPVIQDVQISSPRTDKDEFYEAWIKYRLRLLTPQGQELTSWDLAAYGKHRAAAIGGSNSGLTAAVREAMRDAAAGMALIFRDGNGFRARLLASVAMPGTPSAPIAAPTGEAKPAPLPPPPPPPGTSPKTPPAPAGKKPSSGPVIFGPGGSGIGTGTGPGSGGSGGSGGTTFP